jgi:hypothetical protein
MKHILNDLTDQEKNAIREQHTGGMKVINENFSKLLNSKLGDSKPLVAEQIQDRIVPSGPSPSAKPKVVKDKITSPSSMTNPTSPSPQSNNIVPCSKLGIKSLGSCDSKTKRPVDYCSALGVKTPGYCYIDTKQPMTSTSNGSMQNEQVKPGNAMGKGSGTMTGTNQNAWAKYPCVAKLKDATSPKGQKLKVGEGVFKDLQFYPNGRCMDSRNKSQSFYKCHTGGVIVVSDDPNIDLNTIDTKTENPTY